MIRTRSSTLSYIATALRNLFVRFGFDVRRAPNPKANAGPIPHARVEPNASYSPWYADAEFLKVNDRIKYHTMVDIFRCFELWQLIAEAGKLP